MIILKKATITDIPTLISIEQTVANLKTYSAIITKEEWEEELSKSTVYIIQKDDKPIGNISYEMKESDQAHLSGFSIMPDFQGKGVGREALNKVLDELKNINKIDLVTHPHNTSAIILYLSSGFVINAWKDNYFGDGEPRISLLKEK